jgi:hypothetical protein
MTDKNILHDRLDKARAVIAAPNLPGLKAEAAKTQSAMDWIKEHFKFGSTTPAQDAEKGHAKQALSKASDAVARLETDIRNARQEVAYLERLLNGDAALAQAREGWRIASAAHIAAAKASEAARDAVERINSMLAEEEGKSQAAKDNQRAALLVELGLSDKADGATAAASAKALIGSEARTDALRSALPGAQEKVMQADTAVLTCDGITKKAEQAILDAKQSIAECDQVIAFDACRAAVLAYHAATLAATGAPGPRVFLYNEEEGRGYLEQEAERIKALALVGE